MATIDGRGLERREFLRRCACMALGGAGVGTLGGLELLQAAAAATGPYTDYRALVCVFLFGGHDSFNMVVPTSTAEYTTYATARQALAVPQSGLLQMSPNLPPAGGGSYGFHPSCAELSREFDQGRLAVVGNAGTLLYPTTRAQYTARTVPLPPQLFSHNDQQTQWQTGRPDARGDGTGWFGRIADVMDGAGLRQDLVVNVSLNGNNAQQTGRTSLAYNVSPSGVVRLRGIDTANATNRRRKEAFDALLAQTQDNPFGREYSAVQQRAIANANRITDALAALPAFSTPFPTGSGVASQLQMVARLIGIRNDLALARQVFFVGMGGWDTHGDQTVRHPQLMAQLSAALGAFQSALTELRIADSVVTFTASDFGRTLTSNGDGSDHGWGGHYLVMGVPVRGRQIYGTMPSLSIDGPDDTRGGRLIPTTSVDAYGATLARWFGITDGQLPTVFPNIGRFPSSNLGFLP